MAEHKHAEAIRAWADGATIQILNSLPDNWVDCKFNRPEWHIANSYRVKPEPKPDSIVYMGLSMDGSNICIPLDSISNKKWDYKMKITIDGETNEPKSVELVK